MFSGTGTLRQVLTVSLLIVCLTAFGAPSLIDLILFFSFIPHALHHAKGSSAMSLQDITVLVW